MRNTRILVTYYGGPESLRVVQEKRPEPTAGEVRVKVLAAGVSYADLLMREGVHPETPPQYHEKSIHWHQKMPMFFFIR